MHPRRFARIRRAGNMSGTVKVQAGPNTPLIDCKLVDYSAGGACLELSGQIRLPRAIRIVLRHHKEAMPYRVEQGKAHRRDVLNVGVRRNPAGGRRGCRLPGRAAIRPPAGDTRLMRRSRTSS